MLRPPFLYQVPLTSVCEWSLVIEEEIKGPIHNLYLVQVWASLALAPLLTTKSCKFSLFWGHISQFSLNFDTRPPLFANPGFRSCLCVNYKLLQVKIFKTFFFQNPLSPKIILRLHWQTLMHKYGTPNIINMIAQCTTILPAQLLAICNGNLLNIYHKICFIIFIKMKL